MRKHELHGVWNRYRDTSIVILLTVMLISGAGAIIALRSNNQKMLALKNEVYAADEKNGDVEAALIKLRNHIYSHMNTNLRAGSTSSEPPIQLVNKFNRMVAAEQARIAALNNSTSVYSEAQARCEKASIPLTTRAQCIQDYVSANGNGIPQLSVPPKEFYTFDFASPTWTPDIAGISLVVFAVSSAMLLIRLIAGLIVKLYL